MTILLVDDERPALEALCTSVDWKALGFSSVQTACDLEEGRRVMEQMPVSVLLCDIEMPGGSGLELLQWVKVHRPDTVSILFTCHADFDYARQAVALGAFDYLLKPSPMDAVARTAANAAREWKRRREQERREGQWEKNKDVVFERFWLEAVMGDLPESREKLRAAAARRGLEPELETRWRLMVCTVGQSGVLTQWQAVDLDYAFKNILAELFSFERPAIILSDTTHRKLLLLPEDKNVTQTVLEARCGVFFEAVEKHFGTWACFYAGEPVYAERLAQQHRQLTMLERQNISFRDKVFFGAQQMTARGQGEPAALERWRALLQQREAQPLRREMRDWLRRQAKSGSLNAKQLELFYHDVLQMLYTVLSENNITAAQLLRDQERPEQVLRSVDDTADYLDRLVERSCAYLEDLAQQNTLIERVKEYIEAHLAEDISRDELAGVVYLNPNYLSRLFHQETGKQLVDYITQRRIERVKYLLRTTELSVTEAAGEMGYTNMPYFSRVFKKKVGCTPVEYRRDVRAGK